ncbi:hypothetical protein F8M41_007955 [Gigaspora margarita]|uniref:Uncharacterized protein n=1 Tax=Gigaspora margarita TaxID=4874 RepID=A0A8H4A2P8_GIGMA|nr:hypothetical protein F8M41_007955 [Gigaspora margarita]
MVWMALGQQHDLELFVLNAKYDPSKKPASVKDFFNSKHVERTSGNKMVIDFVAKRNGESKEDLEPDRFYYYVLMHQDSKISIAKDAEKQIESFYKEQTDPFKQLTLDFNPSSLLKRKNSTDPTPTPKRTKYLQIESSENSSSKIKRKHSSESNTISIKKVKITDYFHKDV